MLMHMRHHKNSGNWKERDRRFSDIVYKRVVFDGTCPNLLMSKNRDCENKGNLHMGCPQETVQRVPDSASDVLEIAGDVVDVDDVEISHDGRVGPASAKTEDGPSLPRSSPTPLQTAEC